MNTHANQYSVTLRENKTACERKLYKSCCCSENTTKRWESTLHIKYMTQ